MKTAKNVDEYIASFPKEVQSRLKQVRAEIKSLAPQAEEGISYGMPSYKLNKKPLVYFAGYANHVGFYATPSGHEEFAKELSKYKQGKGSVQLPNDEPLPLKLIGKMVAFRVKENSQKAAPPKAKKKPETLTKDTLSYHKLQEKEDRAICELLFQEINKHLPEAAHKIWHGHPVWFLDGNPVVGYSKLKGSVRLLFWSGQSFDEPGLHPEGSFKAAEARYTEARQVNTTDLKRWLGKARSIQWDYKNIVKRRGKLERLK